VANHGAQDHHGSHRDLLWSSDDVQPKPLDAIIVPTARPPAYLAPAASLAQALGCPLVTLHSKQWTSADMAAERLPRSLDLIAIDVPDVTRLRLPRWRSSRMLAEEFPWLLPSSDLSAKRNIGLMLSRLLGWSRIMFLDDDITALSPADVRRASGSLDTHNAVGLQVYDFPDHSVVCHAYRDAGGEQQSFIGGGALVVHARRNRSFFPEIYNDDWFFLLDGDKGIQPIAVSGRVKQYRYDPFRTPDRARAEEFGDVLAEGIYWLLDKHLSIADADQPHWTMYLDVRRKFIEHVLEMVTGTDIDPAEKARRVAALKGSLGRLARLTPELCENYLKIWQADQRVWQRHLQRLNPRPGRERALAKLTGENVPPLHYRLGAAGTQRYRPANPAPRTRPIAARAPELRPPDSEPGARLTEQLPVSAGLSSAVRNAAL
jgi:hypothetical protein